MARLFCFVELIFPSVSLLHLRMQPNRSRGIHLTVQNYQKRPKAGVQGTSDGKKLDLGQNPDVVEAAWWTRWIRGFSDDSGCGKAKELGVPTMGSGVGLPWSFLSMVRMSNSFGS